MVSPGDGDALCARWPRPGERYMVNGGKRGEEILREDDERITG